jgi:hypothetical protein
MFAVEQAGQEQMAEPGELLLWRRCQDGWLEGQGGSARRMDLHPQLGSQARNADDSGDERVLGWVDFEVSKYFPHALRRSGNVDRGLDGTHESFLEWLGGEILVRIGTRLRGPKFFCKSF